MNVTSNFEVFLGVAGFTSVGRPVFILTQSQFLTQSSLQISQIKVSPLDPNGKHLLLKFQAVWLCRLGEIIHQSLILGCQPKMAVPRVECLFQALSLSLWMVFSDLLCVIVVL